MTLEDLEDRARSAISRKEQFVYDLADEQGQILANVAHMHWFRTAVMCELARTRQRWQHLLKEVESL